MIGRIDREEWEQAKQRARHSFAMQRLGVGDLILVATSDPATLDHRRLNGKTRRRRNFELHRQLEAPLFAWYRAMDRLEPGRVFWGLPTGRLSDVELARGSRRVRSGTDLFDQFLRELDVDSRTSPS
jgi:hypothetical protein